MKTFSTLTTISMATSPFLPPTTLFTNPKLRRINRPHFLSPLPPPPLRVAAFQRGDFESFKRRVLSGDALKEAWRSANDGFEQLVFDSKKAAERFDRRYEVSRRLSSAAETASVRLREIDRELEVSQKWRAFSLDFSRNWPRYRKQLNDFLDTPLGRTSSTIFFLWFALSGWLFRCLIFATWVLPIAGPLVISVVANNMTVKGACPACKREFIGVKNSMIRCQGCGNIVWQPQGDLFSKDDKKNKWSNPKSEVIDVEFEEK